MGAPSINESELARRLGVKPPAVINRRRIGTAPPYRRCECGHTVLYEDNDDLKRWVEQHRKSA